MKQKLIFIALSGLLAFTAKAQNGFMAGTAVESIEPPEYLMSLHLGGYGAPKDGRFTLQWIKIGSVPAAQSVAGLNDRIYILNNNALYFMRPGKGSTEWKKAGMADDIVSIAGYDDKIFGINSKGNIFEGSVTFQIKWKFVCKAECEGRLMTINSGVIWLTDGKGTLWTSSLKSADHSFSKSELPNGAIAFSSGGSKLYILDSEGTIYRKDLKSSDKRWLRMAYKNNETIKQDIRQLAFLNDRMYGIDTGNTLYLGEHRTEGNLSARALAIKAGDQTTVIVNVDVCGLNDFFTGPLKQEIYRKHHIPASAVFINCSHTHFAPVSQNWLTWQEANQRPDSIYLNRIVRNGITEAVDKALSSLEPAELWFGRGTTDIGYNRSLKDHPELYDSDVDVLKLTFEKDKRESYLFMAACHPVFSTAGTLHYTISANYPGVARKLVEERTGTSNSLFLQGTAGDINPRDNGEYISGEKLANEVISTLGRQMTKIEGPISCFLDTVKIPIKPWTKDEILAYRKDNEGKTGDVYAEKNIKWADLMMDYYSHGTMPDALPVYVQTLNIGNWKLVGFSRETTTGYSFGVKKMWPGKLVSVAGYTNDVSSYLPTHMHLEAKNYEGLDSFFWYGSPNVFPMDADELILDKISRLAH